MAREDYVDGFEEIMANLTSRTPDRPDAPPVTVAEPKATEEVLAMLIEPEPKPEPSVEPELPFEPEDMAGIPNPAATPEEITRRWTVDLINPLTLAEMKEKLARLKGGA